MIMVGRVLSKNKNIKKNPSMYNVGHIGWRTRSILINTCRSGFISFLQINSSNIIQKDIDKQGHCVIFPFRQRKKKTLFYGRADLSSRVGRSGE